MSSGLGVSICYSGEWGVGTRVGGNGSTVGLSCHGNCFPTTTTSDWSGQGIVIQFWPVTYLEGVWGVLL